MSEPRIAAVWTRDPGSSRAQGRLNTIAAIRSVLDEYPGVVHLRVHSLAERHTLGDGLGALALFLRRLFTERPLPLQTVLFGAASEHRRLLDSVAAADIVYLDTIRLFLLGREIRHRYSRKRLVCDLDDLMSRRMALVRHRRLELSVGYLHHRFPGVITRLLARPGFAGIISGYEERALRRVEREMHALADAVTLVSRADAEVLSAQLGVSDRHGSSRIHVIPPPVEVRRPCDGPHLPLRFVFLGADRLIQNRLTIENLVDLWRRWRPATELHLFGNLTRSYAMPAGVVVRGYVDSLEEIYDGHSILLVPSFLPGGIKTKVPEAFSYSCPVVGNAATFEGLSLSGYPLILDGDEGWRELLTAPERSIADLREAAQMGQAFVARELSFESFRERWRAALGIGRD